GCGGGFAGLRIWRPELAASHLRHLDVVRLKPFVQLGDGLERRGGQPDQGGRMRLFGMNGRAGRQRKETRASYGDRNAMAHLDPSLSGARTSSARSLTSVCRAGV